MRLILTLVLFISFPLLADDCDEVPKHTLPLSSKTHRMLTQLTSEVRNDYKKRPTTNPGYRLALAFDTNFKVPVVGTDKYFGRIYFTNNKEEIQYRDELITERRLKEERERPTVFYYTAYKASDINSPKGLTLVKAAGAEVTLKSTGTFSTDRGGRLNLRVKIPMQNPVTYVIDIVVQNGNVQKFIMDGNQRVPFDSFKINAENGMFGGPSILSGIDNIQIIRGGKVTHTINQ